MLKENIEYTYMLKNGTTKNVKIKNIRYEFDQHIGNSTYLTEEEIKNLISTGKLIEGKMTDKEAEIMALSMKYGIKLEEVN